MTQNIQVQNLYEALKAADYYIGRLEMAQQRKAVRDMTEAMEYYRRVGPPLIAAYEREAIPLMPIYSATEDSGRPAEPNEYYDGKSDLDVARHINLALLMCNGISETNAGFDTVVTLNDDGLAAIARIVGKLRKFRGSPVYVEDTEDYGESVLGYRPGDKA